MRLYGRHLRAFQGENGYCYIPYEYLTNPTYCFDAWTVREVENDDMGHEHWDDNDSVDYQQNNGDDEDNDDDHEIQTMEDDGDGDDDGGGTSSSTSSSSGD